MGHLVWQKLLLATTAFAIGFACATAREIEICQLDIPGFKAHCARADKKREIPITQMDGYFCLDEVDFRKVADKLEQCEQCCK